MEGGRFFFSNRKCDWFFVRIFIFLIFSVICKGSVFFVLWLYLGLEFWKLCGGRLFIGYGCGNGVGGFVKVLLI